MCEFTKRYAYLSPPIIAGSSGSKAAKAEAAPTGTLYQWV